MDVNIIDPLLGLLVTYFSDKLHIQHQQPPGLMEKLFDVMTTLAKFNTIGNKKK